MAWKAKLTRVCHHTWHDMIFQELPQGVGPERREQEELDALGKLIKHLVGNGKDCHRGSTLEMALLRVIVPDIPEVQIICQARSLKSGCLSHKRNEMSWMPPPTAWK